MLMEAARIAEGLAEDITAVQEGTVVVSVADPAREVMAAVSVEEDSLAEAVALVEAVAPADGK